MDMTSSARFVHTSITVLIAEYSELRKSSFENHALLTWRPLCLGYRKQAAREELEAVFPKTDE